LLGLYELLEPVKTVLDQVPIIVDPAVEVAEGL
jgi:hypothetical protein